MKWGNFDQLMNSEEFVQNLNATGSIEEMQKLFVQYGVDISVADLNKVISAICAGEEDELSEDALDSVAGGGKIWDWIKSKLNNWFKKQSKKNADAINDILSGL